jgi:hypothetical protein
MFVNILFRSQMAADKLPGLPQRIHLNLQNFNTTKAQLQKKIGGNHTTGLFFLQKLDLQNDKNFNDASDWTLLKINF